MRPNKIEVPQDRFETIHMDLVGPLPQSQGFTHLLTVVDRFIRWPEAIALQSTDTVTVARALMHNWVSRFGVPQGLVSDRGSQFTSQIWTTMAKTLEVNSNK